MRFNDGRRRGLLCNCSLVELQRLVSRGHGASPAKTHGFHAFIENSGRSTYIVADVVLRFSSDEALFPS